MPYNFQQDEYPEEEYYEDLAGTFLHMFKPSDLKQVYDSRIQLPTQSLAPNKTLSFIYQAPMGTHPRCEMGLKVTIQVSGPTGAQTLSNLLNYSLPAYSGSFINNIRIKLNNTVLNQSIDNNMYGINQQMKYMMDFSWSELQYTKIDELCFQPSDQFSPDNGVVAVGGNPVIADITTNFTTPWAPTGVAVVSGTTSAPTAFQQWQNSFTQGQQNMIFGSDASNPPNFSGFATFWIPLGCAHDLFDIVSADFPENVGLCVDVVMNDFSIIRRATSTTPPPLMTYLDIEFCTHENQYTPSGETSYAGWLESHGGLHIFPCLSHNISMVQVLDGQTNCVLQNKGLQGFPNVLKIGMIQTFGGCGATAFTGNGMVPQRGLYDSSFFRSYLQGDPTSCIISHNCQVSGVKYPLNWDGENVSPNSLNGSTPLIGIGLFGRLREELIHYSGSSGRGSLVNWGSAFNGLTIYPIRFNFSANTWSFKGSNQEQYIVTVNFSKAMHTYATGVPNAGQLVSAVYGATLTNTNMPFIYFSGLWNSTGTGLEVAEMIFNFEMEQIVIIDTHTNKASECWGTHPEAVIANPRAYV
jgi:hypothetical protein